MNEVVPFDSALDVLDADHELVMRMLLEYEALCEKGASEEVRKTLAERICREVALHLQIEEALEEHLEEKELIAYIRTTEPSSGDYDATVKALGEAFDEHVLAEREEVFVQAKHAPLDLRALAVPLQLRRKELQAAARASDPGTRTAKTP